MIGSLTYLFWMLFVLVCYIGYKYKQSRNKKIFFQGGIYRPLAWVFVLLISSTLFFTFLIPEEPYDLSFLKFHSDEVVNYQNNETGSLEFYLLQSISVFTEMHILGLLAALFILAIWLYFIRSLDFYSKEKISATTLVLCVSMVATFFTFPISDLVTQGLDINYSENTFYNLFVYCFVGIGLVEEFVKAIPVLIILFLTSEVDEPFDIIYYACVSALGFAFIENLLYFREVSGHLIVGRALTSAIGHMIFASFTFYGIILSRFKFKKIKLNYIFLYVIIGAFMHALYDYLLFEGLTLLFIASFVFFIQAWLIIINNSINNSKHFDYTVVFQHERVKFHIALLLVGLLIFSHLVNGLLFGITKANELFFGSFVLFGMLIFFYLSNMSSLDLFKGHWRPLQLFFSRPSGEAMPGARGFSSVVGIFRANSIEPINHVGKSIRLHAPRSNRNLTEVLSIANGKIADRKKLIYEDGSSNIDWFLIQLEEPLEIIDEFRKDKILIKIRDKSSSLVHDKHIDCWLKLIPTTVELSKEIENEMLVNCGLIIINGSDYVYDHER